MTHLQKIKKHKAPMVTIILLAVALTVLFSGVAVAQITRNLSIGTYGTDVTELQKSLNILGNSLATDGIFGPKTQAAVIKFQLQKGLVPDGIVGPLTRAALAQALQKSVSPSPVTKPTGSSGSGQTPSIPTSRDSGTYAAPAPSPAPVNTGRKEVLGYIEPLDPAGYSSVSSFSGYMTSVSNFSYQVTPWGGLQGSTPSGTVQLAKSRGLKVYALIHNMNGKFDPYLASQVLAIPQNRTNLVNNVLNTLRNNGYSGVQVDIEGIYKSDRGNYVTFLRELKRALAPYGLSVTVAIPAKTSDNPWNSWSNGYDYYAIGQVADKVTIMTYDENWGQNGPVASMGWVTNCVKYAVSQMPASKVLLGIATYGYDYPTNTAYGMKYIKNTVIPYWGGQLNWSNQYSVPYYTYWKYGTQHTIWFENEYSNAIKMNLVNQYNLGGIAIWRLGYEDQAFWNTVRNKLR